MYMYYLVIIQNEDTQAIYRHYSLDSTMVAFHTEMAYRAEGRTSTKCVILDSDMYIVRSEVYTAPVSDNTEEPTAG